MLGGPFIFRPCYVFSVQIILLVYYRRVAYVKEMLAVNILAVNWLASVLPPRPDYFLLHTEQQAWVDLHQILGRCTIDILSNCHKDSSGYFKVILTVWTLLPSACLLSSQIILQLRTHRQCINFNHSSNHDGQAVIYGFRVLDSDTIEGLLSRRVSHGFLCRIDVTFTISQVLKPVRPVLLRLGDTYFGLAMWVWCGGYEFHLQWLHGAFWCLHRPQQRNLDLLLQRQLHFLGSLNRLCFL